MKGIEFSRRRFIETAGLGITASAFTGCRRSGRGKGKETLPAYPNFVIIFTDDQGYGDVGCYGGRGYRTENLDQMAAEGIRFSDFYVAATVCTPSRAALLTGCYPKRVGLHEAVLYPHSNHGLSPDEVIIPELLKEGGYSSCCIGKWHLGHQPSFLPLRHGFDRFFGVPYSNDMDGHYYRAIDFQSPPLPLYRDDDPIESGPDQNQLTRRYTEEAVRFIRSRGSRPFFLYLAHSMPHLPLHVSENFRGRSGSGLYGDVMEEIDWSVGQILAALREEGLDENTLVVFTSDNGPVLRSDLGSAGPLRGGKATTWEGGQRVPCIMRWPGQIPAGSVCGEVVTSMDILPTMAAVTGTDLSGARTIDGKNILPLLQQPDTAKSPHEAFYYYSRNGDLEAVRCGKWKLHTGKTRGWNRGLGPFPISLYDLELDAGEKDNRAADFPKVVSKLTRMMAEFDADLTRNARPAARID